MGKPLIYEILEKPASSSVIGICSLIWFFIQKRNIGYGDVGLSYEAAMEGGQYWRIITSAFSHISVVHLVFNMSALWSLGVVEQLGQIGLGVEYYLHYTLVLVVLSGLLVLGFYHVMIQKFKVEYFRRVTAVGYSCVVFGWMTILATKQPSSKLNIFGVLSLPISFAPFESLIFTSIMVPQASFIGHLSGIIVGYSIAWGLVHGMNNYWAITMFGWIVLVFVLSLKRTGSMDLRFIEIEPVTDPSLPSVGVVASRNGRTLQMDVPSRRGVSGHDEYSEDKLFGRKLLAVASLICSKMFSVQKVAEHHPVHIIFASRNVTTSTFHQFTTKNNVLLCSKSGRTSPRAHYIRKSQRYNVNISPIHN
ncbi:hypothetical protein OsJ_04394 [Oryza sativa Japonica Group]|uniref:Peptidase S54 rhomboid domain-containing protein n=1 Tax=Oryza sativa subsp. japonica TaxID=39947 RepID=B9EVC0_ORYSJ|nr:hypothetical protein OsJ_04394 [Oryza sativa Japonica Group]